MQIRKEFSQLEGVKMKAYLLSALMILAFTLAGCSPAIPTIQPTQGVQFPSPTVPSTTVVAIPTSTSTLVITETEIPVPTDTPAPLNTLTPEQIKETMEPLLREPMNCDVPCFWGIIPGKTNLDEIKLFFNYLGFTPREGKDFYSIGYQSNQGDGFAVTFYINNNIVENIKLTPDIIVQKAGSPREWIAYSPETLIKRYGSPSRVDFAIDDGPNYVIIMTMYFDIPGLIAMYSGYNMIPERPHSPLLCPLAAPFDYVRLWMGDNPSDPPSFETVSLEDATALTIEQFTQLMLGDPQKACFTLNGDVFQ